MKRMVLAAAVALLPLGAAAQQVPATETPEPARLTAAARLIDVLMPPPRRDAMIAGIMSAMTANTTQSLRSNPALATMVGKDPRVRTIIETFIARQQDEVGVLLKGNLPGMIEAMTRAYARRFTVAEMSELERFFVTPVGQSYMDKGATIMSDPDIVRWQSGIMNTQLAAMPARVRALQAEILALDPPAKTR